MSVLAVLARVAFTGADPLGRNLDDASFFRPATKPGPHNRILGIRPQGTLRGPLWRVALARFLIIWPTFLVLITGGFSAAAWYWGIILTAVVTGAGWLGLKWWKRRHLRREVIIPTWRAVCTALPQEIRANDRDALRNIHLPRTFEKPGDTNPVRIYLPTGTVAEDRARTRLKSVAATTLGIDNPQMSAHFRGRRPWIEISEAPKLSELVPYAKHRELITTYAAAGTPFLGMGVGNEPVVWEMEDEAAHWLISGAPGSGKSVQIRSVVSALLGVGWAGIIADRKRHSHPWAWNLPNCLYAHQIDQIGELLLLTQKEAERRVELSPEELKQQVPVIFVLEEAQILMRKLQKRWFMQGGYRTAPAVDAFVDLLTMGRELRIHLATVMQRASAPSFGGGGGDMRECFSLVTAGRWKLNTWKMLAEGAPYMRPPGGPGGLVEFQGGGAKLYRGTWQTVDEAHELALSGPHADVRAVLGGDGRMLEPSPDDLAGEIEGGEPDIPELATVAEMVAILGRVTGETVDKEALRKQLQRNAEVAGKRGGSNLYSVRRAIELREKPSKTAAALDAPMGRPGLIYEIDIYDDAGQAVPCWYIGQSFQPWPRRIEQHRERSPFGDRIADARIIWRGFPTPDELFEIEMRLIAKKRPPANYEGQAGQPWAIPIYTQWEQRWARDDAAGRPRLVKPERDEPRFERVPVSRWDSEWPVLEEVS